MSIADAVQDVVQHCFSVKPYLAGISLFQQFVKAAYQAFITCIKQCSPYCSLVIARNNDYCIN